VSSCKPDYSRAWGKPAAEANELKMQQQPMNKSSHDAHQLHIRLRITSSDLSNASSKSPIPIQPPLPRTQNFIFTAAQKTRILHTDCFGFKSGQKKLQMQSIF